MVKQNKPVSTGKDGKLDSRRWVVITLRNSGASEAQFPLPVTINGERISFDRDQPVISPAYYLDTIHNTVLPRYEKINNQDTSSNRVRSEDSHAFVGLRYAADIEEIPEEYQTIETIADFATLLRSDDCPPAYSHLRNVVFGQVSFGKHNYDYSNLIKDRNQPKQAAKSGSTNSK